MARRHQDELITSAGEEHIALHEQPADPLLDQGRESRVDLAVGAGGQDAMRLSDDAWRSATS
jgi:hypothetical protein